MAVAANVGAWLPFLWSVLAALLIWGLWRRGLIANLVNRIKGVTGFGVGFEFSETSAKATRDGVEEGLTLIRQTIRREIEAEVRAKSLQNGLKQLFGQSSLAQNYDFRATIHIPDPLFQNSLYQLLDYYPSGAGHGRSFSVRSGLIGLAWRTDTSQQWVADSGIKLETLIKEWGMTDREASERRVVENATQVMLGVPLHDPSSFSLIGVLYLDSAREDCFGRSPSERDQLLRDLDDVFQKRLAVPLAAIVEHALVRSPQLSIGS